MLLGPDDPAPFSVFNAGGSASVLFVSDHSGRAFPHRLQQLGLDDWVLEQHVSWDIGSGDVARRLAQIFDAPLIAANYSRLVVDTNRNPKDSTLCTEKGDGIAIPGNIDLPDEQRAERIDLIHRPYHAAIEARLNDFRQRGIIPAIIAIHSCTPVFNDVVRPWHFGVLWDVDPRIAQPLLKNLGALEGISVGDNEPYSGRHPHDYTMDHHGEAGRIPHVSIEVRQDLIDTEGGASRHADMLADALRPILADESLYTLLDERDAVR
ncbi:MAG: N-formylglutamate amidohydrolase [Pseudomonadota bacterium]